MKKILCKVENVNFFLVNLESAVAHPTVLRQGWEHFEQSFETLDASMSSRWWDKLFLHRRCYYYWSLDLNSIIECKTVSNLKLINLKCLT